MWALLSDALKASSERPRNSVTPYELAERSGFSVTHCAKILRANASLRAVPYQRNGRRAVCYVPVQSGAVSTGGER